MLGKARTTNQNLPPAALLTALVVLSGGLALATSFAAIPFPNLIWNAPNIVRGKVIRSYSNNAMEKDGSQKIFTYNEIQIDEVLKGSLTGTSVMAREMGGIKDGVGLSIPGTAVFKKGEDVMVMLSAANGDGSMDVVGLMTGKYDVIHQEDGSEVLHGGAFSSEVLESQPGQKHEVVPPAKWTLQAVRELIQYQKFHPLNSANPGETETAAAHAPKLEKAQAALVPSAQKVTPTKAESTLEKRDIASEEEKTSNPLGSDGLRWWGILLGAAALVLVWVKRKAKA